MKRKLTNLALVLIMCLSLAIPVTAAEPERVEITVASENEILEFLNSP